MGRYSDEGDRPYEGARMHQGAAVALALPHLERLLDQAQQRADGRIVHLLLSPTAHNELLAIWPSGESVALGAGIEVSRSPALKGYWCVLISDHGEWFEERAADSSRWARSKRAAEKRRLRTEG